MIWTGCGCHRPVGTFEFSTVAPGSVWDFLCFTINVPSSSDRTVEWEVGLLHGCCKDQFTSKNPKLHLSEFWHLLLPLSPVSICPHCTQNLPQFIISHYSASHVVSHTFLPIWFCSGKTYKLSQLSSHRVWQSPDRAPQPFSSRAWSRRIKSRIQQRSNGPVQSKSILLHGCALPAACNITKLSHTSKHYAFRFMSKSSHRCYQRRGQKSRPIISARISNRQQGYTKAMGNLLYLQSMYQVRREVRTFQLNGQVAEVQLAHAFSQ